MVLNKLSIILNYSPLVADILTCNLYKWYAPYWDHKFVITIVDCLWSLVMVIKNACSEKF